MKKGLIVLLMFLFCIVCIQAQVKTEALHGRVHQQGDNIEFTVMFDKPSNVPLEVHLHCEAVGSQTSPTTAFIIVTQIQPGATQTTATGRVPWAASPGAWIVKTAELRSGDNASELKTINLPDKVGFEVTKVEPKLPDSVTVTPVK